MLASAGVMYRNGGSPRLPSSQIGVGRGDGESTGTNESQWAPLAVCSVFYGICFLICAITRKLADLVI